MRGAQDERKDIKYQVSVVIIQPSGILPGLALPDDFVKGAGSQKLEESRRSRRILGIKPGVGPGTRPLGRRYGGSFVIFDGERW